MIINMDQQHHEVMDLIKTLLTSLKMTFLRIKAGLTMIPLPLDQPEKGKVIILLEISI